ncbi:Gfo/Idh/MocA family oxidoreductase [Candidatus Kaiserbacteria bacterium]|nr:Gfo/Idh/MocA family oxidoreductase [Candidatus Kaiserbacteria bacterium]
MNLTTPIKVAVIGAGATSQKVHLPALHKLRNEGLVSLQVISGQSHSITKDAQKRFGFSDSEDDVEVLFTRDDVDAVYIFGSAQRHYKYAKRALLNKKHVFVEKPPSIDSLHALEIIQLAKEKNRTVMVGFNRRFQASLLRAKKEITHNSNIYSIEATFDKPALLRPPPYGAKTWLSANGIHAIDVLQFFVGTLPKALYSTYNITIGDIPQNFSALIIWDTIHATLSANNSAGRQNEEYVIHGTGISYSVKSRVLEQCKNDICTKISLPESRGFQEEHRHFISFLSGKEELRSSMLDGAVALRLTELIEAGHTGLIDWSDFTVKETISTKKF